LDCGLGLGGIARDEEAEEQHGRTVVIAHGGSAHCETHCGVVGRCGANVGKNRSSLAWAVGNECCCFWGKWGCDGPN
jgi:hypothetical protein